MSTSEETENHTKTQNNNKTTEQTHLSSTREQKRDPYGYSLYPERKGGEYSPTWFGLMLGEGKEKTEKFRCEQRVWAAIQNNPLVKLMISALKSSGCEVDVRRHIACEVCDRTVTGGYDTENNQIVICQNMCKMDGLVSAVLTHELIHMFDHCVHKIDFRNVEHLACTEIRAANLTHCSFVSAIAQWDATPMNIAQTHQNCVKTKAAYSVEAVRHIGIREAMKVVEKVFPQCYNDLEPIGRRVKKNSKDSWLAYNSRYHYGY